MAQDERARATTTMVKAKCYQVQDVLLTLDPGLEDTTPNSLEKHIFIPGSLRRLARLGKRRRAK
jgi:hypothetical protein